MKQGFTLVEILVAVMIVTLLVAMAAPMYDKAIEKSRIAEARVTAKKLWDAKARLLDAMDKDKYDGSFTINNLDFAMPCKSVSSDNKVCNTDDWAFSINPGGNTDKAVVNGVCVRRLKGDHSGTVFLYVGEDAPSADEKDYGRFWCTGSAAACDAYAMKEKTTGIKTWSCN